MPTQYQIERFRRDLLAVAGAEPEGLALGVSGGPDSLALLLLAHGALPGRVEAATVDHRLRPENEGEAAFVATVCAGLGVPHATLADPDAPIAGASLQARARALRYRLLLAWGGERGLTALATAHHADDQAETVLMRLARGGGLGGLSGVRARRNQGPATILRPLLGWRRSELAGIVAAAGLAAVDDPSNRSEAHDRTRFRALLAGSEVLPPERLAASAAHLAEAEQALEWAADGEWGKRAVRDGDALTLDPAGLPPELLRRLAARAITEVGANEDWRAENLPRLLAAALAGDRVTLAGVLIGGGGSRLRFEPAPPRRPVKDGAAG